MNHGVEEATSKPGRHGDVLPYTPNQTPVDKRYNRCHGHESVSDDRRARCTGPEAMANRAPLATFGTYIKAWEAVSQPRHGTMVGRSETWASMLFNATHTRVCCRNVVWPWNSRVPCDRRCNHNHVLVMQKSRLGHADMQVLC